MDRLEAMRIFVTVVDAGSLAAAARRLGRSPALVTRAVAQLEATAKLRLLERTARHFAVTEEGARHASAYRSILEEVSRLDAAPTKAEIAGSVVVTAPELFGRLKVMPLVEGFIAAHPGASVRLLLLNRIVGLVEEGVDVAVRLAHLADSSMTAIKVGDVRRLTCAAPSYLAEHTAPVRPADLQAHACIGLNEGGAQELWRYRGAGPGNRAQAVRVTCRLALNGAAAAIDAAERGMGLVRPLSYQVERAIESGSLVTVLEGYEPEPVPVHLVFRPGGDKGSAVRAFVDHAVPLLRREFGHLPRAPARQPSPRA